MSKESYADELATFLRSFLDAIYYSKSFSLPQKSESQSLSDVSADNEAKSKESRQLKKITTSFLKKVTKSVHALYGSANQHHNILSKKTFESDLSATAKSRATARIQQFLNQLTTAEDINFALVSAAEDGNEAIVLLLLCHAAVTVDDINEALSDAARRGHDNIVRLLIDYATDQSLVVIAGVGDALVWAAYRGHENMVVCLLNYATTHPIPVAADSVNKAFFEAVSRGNENILRLLINYATTSSLAETYDYNRALIPAARNNNINIVLLLLANRTIQQLLTIDGVNNALGWATDPIIYMALKAWLKEHPELKSIQKVPFNSN